jgi:hypothetical protein
MQMSMELTLGPTRADGQDRIATRDRYHPMQLTLNPDIKL